VASHSEQRPRAESGSWDRPDEGTPIWGSRSGPAKLSHGAGHWQGNEIGRAAREKNEAARRHREADEFARYPGMSIRMRHSWRKSARQWSTAELEATQRYDELAAPHEEHETGWCRDCAQYVQRALGGSAWALRPGHERGAWMWRNYCAPVGRG
jgi:hypothetical protein